MIWQKRLTVTPTAALQGQYRERVTSNPPISLLLENVSRLCERKTGRLLWDFN